MFRVGMGYDVHRLDENRNLIIGGVKIPYELGLVGYSDADVLIHAIIDSLLGAAGLGDIGTHFPDNDKKYKGISSIELLQTTVEMLKNKFLYISNLDCTIVAEKPKMAPYTAKMKKIIADVIGVSPNQVNIKATTEEGLGFTGQQQGISATSIVLLIESRRETYD
ncbi:MAG: 2-C-methyl-D-erythritol 2,4-cyclodiphosphate synthase [Epulopiscium sp. Nuni2H_MBin003]|nr:MAG: 2-C-methyl-D-erythritol 2,4-cyclodiphosphate synthase [Epulopiscium sp. Nuni2H_MBin003]